MEPINKVKGKNAFTKAFDLSKQEQFKLLRQINQRNAPINKFITSLPSIKSLRNKVIVSTNANRDRAMQRFYKQSQKGNVSLDRMDRMFLGKKDQGEIAKNNQKIRSYNRTVLAKKIVKNMGKLSPYGLVGAIMTPKEAGAGSTLTQSGEYVPRKKVKTY